MEAYQQRMIDERDLLQERLRKGKGFTHSKTFAAQPETDRVLLETQLGLMQLYLDVLNARIAHFEGVKPHEVATSPEPKTATRDPFNEPNYTAGLGIRK